MTDSYSVDVGWLTGDLIAGLTVGIVLVPQGMSYAQVNITRAPTPSSLTTFQLSLHHLPLSMAYILRSSGF